MIATNQRQHVIGNFPINSNLFHETMVEACDTLYARTGVGNEMTDWLEWPADYIKSEEYISLKVKSSIIKATNKAVIVVGIGGSYLTAQMLIHSKYGEFYNEIAEKKGLPKIYFLGCDLSPDRLNQTLELVKDCDWSVIYISKSGGTIEPALTYRVLWNELCKRYGTEADARVYTITDAEKGILKSMTDKHGWDYFVIPDGIGGRYSGLTAVGLLTAAIAGIDTDALLKGAIDAMHDCKENYESFAAQYAKWRFYNYFKKQRKVEFYAANTPYLMYCNEWLKQLFGESEGKDGKGIFPASGVFPTDLHSLGQYLQEGEKILFETIIEMEFRDDIEIPSSKLNDQLDVYVGKKFTQAASAAMKGAFKAHSAGGNPCGTITIGNTTEDMGYFMYSMFVACAISAYMIKVNPFNQPGVELHKTEMKKALLEG